MNKAKRILALVLCAALILALFAGCNKQSGDNGKTTDDPNGSSAGKNSGNGGSSGSSTASEFVYRPTYTPFPDTVNWIQTASFGENCIFFVTEEVTGARRVFYDEEWKELGHIEIDPSEIENEYGIYEEGDEVNGKGFGITTAEGADESDEGDADVTPDTDVKTDDQGRRYNEELDIWYMYTSDEQVYEQVLYKMNLDGTGAEKLPDFKPMEIPEDKQGNSYIESMTVGPDGSLWLTESGNYYHFDDNGEYFYDGDASSIRKLSQTGATIAELDISSIRSDSEYTYFRELNIDAQGNLFLLEGNSNTLYIFDSEGKRTGKIEMGDNYVNRLLMIGGQIYGTYWDDTGHMVLAPIDIKTGKFGDSVAMPANVYNFYTGGGEYDMYFNNGSDFCGYNIATGETTTLLNWIDSDINSDTLNQIFVDNSGAIYATSQDWNSGGWELAKFTKVPGSEIPARTVLTLACSYLSYNLRSAIINYNKTSDKYRIKVNDYSIFNTEDDYNAGITKLSTEIISGVVPDLIVTTSLPFNTYMKKGLLEDLLPFIESDDELHGNIMMEAFKPVMTADGKLPIVASGFSIQTVVGASAIVGDKPGWTIRDLQTALSRMPDGASAFGNEMSRIELLNYMCQMTQSDYIDYETGKCSFNSDEFKDFLRFIASYPEEIDWDSLYGEDYDWSKDGIEAQIAAGRVMLSIRSFSDFWDYQYCQGIFLNKPFTYIGFPSSSGKGSSISYNVPIAMSTTCSDKEGAWDFMRTILLPGFDSYGFSTNKTIWDERAKEMTEPQYYYDDTGKKVEYKPTQYVGGKEIEIDRMTQANLDQILDLLNYCTPQTSIDQKVLSIIMEDAQAFFKGQKSVDDVCASIQSRVTIYINETM